MIQFSKYHIKDKKTNSVSWKIYSFITIAFFLLFNQLNSEPNQSFIESDLIFNRNLTGASAWSYFVPYEKNINNALKKLKDKVFKERDYWGPGMYVCEIFDGIMNLTGKDSFEVRWYELSKEISKRGSPQTIEELLQLVGDEGTSCILDIDQVYETTNLNKSGTISNDELLRIFNTTKPTHQMVVELEEELYTYRYRGLCTYIIVYEKDKPKEIYFTGYSGD